MSDDSGSIKLTLWNDDIQRFKEGDSIKIINGFVNEFQGEAQLTSGKFGRREKAGEGGVVSEEASENEIPKKKNKKIKEFEEEVEDDSETESEDGDIEEVEY